MRSGLEATRRAFDAVAAEYDGPIGNNELVQRIRRRTVAAFCGRVPAGAPVLELGCGTGLDAAELGARGYRVLATDWAPAMVERTRARVTQLGLERRVEARVLGMQELDRLPEASQSAAFSDLGALNCAPDPAALAGQLARVLRPGGVLVASVIARFCPWELALQLRQGRTDRARVRWTSGMVPVPLRGETVWTRYYSRPELLSTFGAAGFRSLGGRALGLLTPPPYVETFPGRHRRLLSALQAAEDTIAGWRVLRGWGDHILVELQLDR